MQKHCLTDSHEQHVNDGSQNNNNTKTHSFLVVQYNFQMMIIYCVICGKCAVISEAIISRHSLHLLLGQALSQECGV